MTRRVLRLLCKEAVDPLVGQLVIPNSKYHAHRALILASLARGTSRIHGLSDAGHVRHTIGALRRLGTGITIEGDTFSVRGGRYRPSGPELSVGSSGTTLYFMTGLAALADRPVTVVGQRYFQRRPIRPLLDALSRLGVELSSSTGCPPISVAPRRPRGGEVTISGTLSQWISGLLLLAPFASGPSVIEVEGPLNERSYIDLTIRMMSNFGLSVRSSLDGRRYEIEGGQQAVPAEVTLPPDIGSAAFGLAATALHPSDVLFQGLRARSASETDHPEAELLDIIGEMGLPMEVEAESGLVRVRHDGLELQPVHVDCRDVPDMLPILSVLGTFAQGVTVLEHVAHVRLKESDRVSAMLQLNRMGGSLEQKEDRLICRGVERLHGADLSSFNDHRVLMALAVAASRADGETRLTYPNAYRISYPRFLHEMTSVGLPMSVESSEPSVAARTSANKRARRVDPEKLAATPITEYVRLFAGERPEELAVAEGGDESSRQLSWRELDSQADALAAFLRDVGIAPSEPVAYQLPNWTEFVVASLAILRAGGLCCPLMPIFREREIAFMLSRSKARVLFVPHSFRERAHSTEIADLVSADKLPTLRHVIVVRGDEAVAPANGVLWHSFTEALASGRNGTPRGGAVPAPTGLAQLLFTSGTSGEPKGVLHRMDVLTRAAAMEVRHLGLSGSDRVFIPSPLAHQTGFLYGMWLAWLIGVPQVLQATWNGRRAIELMKRFGVTFVQAATPFLSDLMVSVDETGDRPDSLRIFVATGAAVPRGLAEQSTRTLKAAVCGAWGTTETCLGSLSAPEDEPAKVWGTDGRALQDVRLRVTDDLGNVLAAGQEGNFEVRSKCLFEGYLNHPDWTAEAMTEDGWYRSGDLAVIDESGFVRISGRVKDVINRGGEKVPVGEIEQLLHTHPAVLDVAIVAMPDERLGERACAFVVAGPGFGFAEMRRFLDENKVAKQYWPERLELVDELPRNPTGKIQKFLLREQVRHGLERERHP